MGGGGAQSRVGQLDHFGVLAGGNTEVIGTGGVQLAIAYKISQSACITGQLTGKCCAIVLNPLRVDAHVLI